MPHIYTSYLCTSYINLAMYHSVQTLHPRMRCTTCVRKGNQCKELYNIQNVMLNNSSVSIQIRASTFIFHPINPKVAADAWIYFHFKYPPIYTSGTVYFPSRPWTLTLNGTWALCLSNKGK